MVVRVKSRKRKLLGQRSWGVGNIKNARGKGSRGGTGKGGRKGKWTHIVVYEKERMRTKGFNKWKKRKLKVIDLAGVSKLAANNKGALDLKGYKVLGDGTINVAVVVKADSFSKIATEKIVKAGGEAQKLDSYK